jgi:endonuclease/exonuclease/phosphatase (EEP) superfamily protein YafD
VLLGASISSAHAANQGSISVMTQNLYQGTELANTLAATNQTQFVLGVAKDYNNVIATNFPERANAFAAEIAQSGPALVGLQEVALWQTQCPYGSGTWTTSYDFLQILLNALAAHGMHYAPVIAHTDYTVSGVGLFSSQVCPSSGGFMGVRFTEGLALLARTDLPTSQLQLANPQQGAYQAAITLQTIIGPVTIGSGWLSVDATTGGSTLRFITTHLSAITLAFGAQAQQMQELLAGPATTTLPIVIAGDFNTPPGGTAYNEAESAGFTDEWAEGNGDAGYTGFQVLPTITNPTSNLSVRIDYVLGRGKIAPQALSLMGSTPSARTPSGLWPSDHAGLVATLKILG